jgi:hypothetical protein
MAQNFSANIIVKLQLNERGHLQSNPIVAVRKVIEVHFWNNLKQCHYILLNVFDVFQVHQGEPVNRPEDHRESSGK